MEIDDVAYEVYLKKYNEVIYSKIDENSLYRNSYSPITLLSFIHYYKDMKIDHCYYNQANIIIRKKKLEKINNNVQI